MSYDGSSNKSTDRVEIIRNYVELQRKLVVEAHSKLHPGATEYDFDRSVPTTVTIDGTTWSTMVHGLGVMFLNRETKIIVDVHEGFIDAPTAFDAWRLVQYAETLLSTDEEFESWQMTLGKLAADGTIEPHDKHKRLYVLTEKRGFSP